MADFVEDMMARITGRMEDELDAIGTEMVDQVRESISVPVEYTGDGGVIRSLRGENPRREYGNLWQSIDHAVTPERLRLDVSAGNELAPYAAKLERELDRPILNPVRAEWGPVVGPRLVAAAEGRR
jgi:hypothetical protein